MKHALVLEMIFFPYSSVAAYRAHAHTFSAMEARSKMLLWHHGTSETRLYSV